MADFWGPDFAALQSEDPEIASVAVYLDGGPRAEPIPSTIIDLTGDAPRELRAGAIPGDEWARALQ